MPKFTIEQLQKDLPEVTNPLLIDLHGVKTSTKKLEDAKQRSHAGDILQYTNKLTDANLRYNKSLENFTTKLSSMGAEANDITEFVQSLNAPTLPEPGKKIIDLSDPFSRMK